MDVNAEVIVIGAGLAGLTTAMLLNDNGIGVLVLEAKGRVGGRLKTQLIAGTEVDAGGSWIGPPQHGVIALAEQLGLSTFPQHHDGNHLLVVDGRPMPFTSDTPPLGWFAAADLAQATWRLDRAAHRLCGPAPWSHPDAERFDRQTLGAWMHRHTKTRGARFVLELITATSFGCHPDELSLLGFLVHVASADGLGNLTGVKGAALDRHIVGGAAALCDELAANLGARVRCDTPVRLIEQADSGLRIVGEDVEFTCQHGVLAVDPAMAGAIEHRPALPPRRATLQRTFAMGSGTKVHIGYAEPFWRRDGLSGLSYADSGLIPVTFDVGQPAGPGILMTFLDHAAWESTGLLDGPPECRRDAVAAELAERFGEQARQPVDYVEQDWSTEPYQAGCVPRPSPGVITAARDAFTRPVGNLHFAGAESTHVWEGHMDGAVASAHRVVGELTGWLPAGGNAPMAPAR
ncbi:putative flavin-containing monoamine oxidase AofH [Mycobacterium antarcticum]|uniref:flavin monoamine oxidase family protein n=1 Tax=Mycolicibacterium sp. TUM20983 TaxID=3023369 RepID=UPI002396D785|nr:FAD-dependent oxidoreductase [Mycolicibacterium sp. TUM20983]GLP75442.1 putative flavin-containing monoamine oxidase AofH [Mycolicibacterium sp. TUM20983]